MLRKSAWGDGQKREALPRKAAMKSDTVPGQISALYKHIQPAVKKADGDVNKAIE